jgi:hypothetical protein
MRFAKRTLFIVFLSLLSSVRVWAYPEFIGYGYASCLTCHYNGHGGGPLTDYGRALGSAEISSHAVFPAGMSDEEIANTSGFFGTKELPYWIRPSAKFRGLRLRANPGSGARDETKFYYMQADVGIAAQDRLSKYVAQITWGRMVAPSEYGMGKQGMDRFLARDYFLRAELVKSWWVYVGLMEKVFGIRNLDHTSFQREPVGFATRNNSADGIGESQSVVVHKVEDHWEIAADYFIGNPYDDEKYKQKGVSLMGEVDVGDKKRVGLSLMTAKSDVLQKDVAAVHYRQGLSKGSAIMTEVGVIRDKDASTGNMKTGSYALVQSLVQMARGYNFKTGIEHYNKEFKSSEPDQWKWSAGFLIFPIPRLELRAEVVNERAITSKRGSEDEWEIQGQIHVSL